MFFLICCTPATTPAPVPIIPFKASEFLSGDFENWSFLEIKSRPTPKLNQAPAVLSPSRNGVPDLLFCIVRLEFCARKLTIGVTACILIYISPV